MCVPTALALEENTTMKNPLLISLAAAGSLALLTACGNTDSTPATEAEMAAEVAEKEAELAQLEADLAEQQAANATPPAAAPGPRPSSTASTPRPTTTAPRPAAASAMITVPAGTELPLSLTTGLTSKSAKVGDTVRAVVTSPVMVDGRTAIASGTTVAGSVIKVVSGSDKIGGTPTLVVAFDRLELPGGKDVPISGEITSTGKSDNTRDTVTIVGGAAAGALLGDQVSSKDRGKVIGGILGAAAGAVAASKTGTEVEMVEGMAISMALAAPVEVTR
jgi:hypothetical protein